MRKVLLITIILLFLFVLVGCEDKSNRQESVDNQKLIHEHCTRGGTVSEGSVVTLYYDLYYQGDVLRQLDSYEGVESTDSLLLDQYEQAYRNVHEPYKDLEYYQASVIRDDTHVVSKISIDYEHINIDELIKIEGEDDNIFEKKVPKASKWKELAKKVGAKCSVVEE